MNKEGIRNKEFYFDIDFDQFVFWKINVCFIFLAHNACGSNPCLNDATCTPVDDGYVCNCTAGWEGLQCQTGCWSEIIRSSNLIVLKLWLQARLL